MIELSHVTRRYGNMTAVDDVSFKIEKGGTVGLLGPNGAGKTTIMKMLTGYLMPSSGSITVDGISVIGNPREAAAKIGFLPEQPPLYLEMDVISYLQFMAEIKLADKASRTERVEEIMETVRITEVKNRVIGNLSKGYRQRVGLAQALMGTPEILILDEPTVGLDPRQIADFRSLMVEIGRGRTVIFSTHILSEIDLVCDMAVILSEGKLVAYDSVESLEQASISRKGGDSFLLHVRAGAEKAQKVLSAAAPDAEITPIESRELGASWFRVRAKDPGVRARIFYALAENKIDLIEMKNDKLMLEQVFLNLTS